MINKAIKIILICLLFIFISIQFFRPEKNINTAIASPSLDNVVKVPDSVRHILKIACNDCHSNNTKYYWYHEIMPIGWYLAEHVEDGKKHLNFSEFSNYTQKKQDHKLEEIVEEIEKHDMPLSTYTWIHREAKLNTQQQQLLIDWVKNARKEIAQ